jgi:hypothetical protein
MEENKIPTYREFLLNRFVEGKSLDVDIVAIEFAKMHVKKALESAEHATNTRGIQHCYPLENIK